MKTTEQMLELREKQLAGCTRAMLDAAIAINDTEPQVAEKLRTARYTGYGPSMEAAIKNGKLYLLTPAQAEDLDRALLNDAKGEHPSGAGVRVAAVLANAESYALDAARQL